MYDHLGPYRIDKQIGRGGMGSVYAGVNEETGEKAAIKVLSPAFAEDPGFRNRFLTEIATLKQLRHKNIVRIRGDGEQDGQLFYVMELVEGRSLQEELQAGHKYDWKETAEIAIQICQALKHAHDNGIIHRDLKPANLLRGPDDAIKLTDFGIAKLFGGTQLTAAGSVVGTADFMSPEQAEGLGVTYRSDLYSLGAVMFTLLARRPPFGGTSLPQIVHNLRFEAAPSVRRFAPRVPMELDQIIDQLLCKKPEERVATALVLANQLRAMKHGLAISMSGEAAESDSDFVKSSVTSAPSDDQVTRISNSDQGPNTELSPASVDDFELREVVESESDVQSWNNVTLATGDVSENRVSKADSPSDGARNSHQTFVEAPQLVNRFTTIEADEYRKRQETIDKPAKWREAIKVLAMIVVLVGMLGTIAWAVVPKADKVYAKIVKIKEQGELDEARILHGQIEHFLSWFPSDPRAEEVRGYQLDIDSKWLFSRLVSRQRNKSLLPVEEQFYQAMMCRESKPDEARKILENLILDYKLEDASTDDARLCIEYAPHQQSRLSSGIVVQPTSPRAEP